MGWISKMFKNSISEGAETLRSLFVELEGLKKSVLSESLEYRRIQKQWDPCKELIMKGEANSLLVSLNNKYEKATETLQKSLQNLSDRQDAVRKGIVNQIVKNPILLPLVFASDFIPEFRYEELTVSLVKGHQEGKVTDQQLKKLVKYKKSQLTEEESVYVKDNRTQYADTIIVDEENRILFVIRNKNDDFCPAGYCLPGGHIEEGETPREGALRELKEETGIELEPYELVPCGEYIDNKSHIYYFCVHSNIEPVVLQEEEQQQWEKVPFDEIDKKPLIMNLQNNLEHLIAIPRILLNTEADNAQKVYFDGKTFKKGRENLPYLRGLSQDCAIIKSNKECFVYGQVQSLEEDLEKASRAHLVPKKAFVSRAGKTYLTTVWVNPATGEVVPGPGKEVRELDRDLGKDVKVGDYITVRTSRGKREGIVECCILTKEGAYLGFRTPEGKYTEAYLKSIKEISVKGSPSVAPTTPPAEGELKPSDIVEVDFDTLPKLGGSSETFLYEVDGKKFFLKKEREGKSGQLKSEVLADKVYRAMGFEAPESDFHEVTDKSTGTKYACKVSKFLEYQELGSLRPSMQEKAYAEIRKGFALDCLLANWDVIGANKDNILASPDKGIVVRIDNGSSFQYRAKGSLKPESSFLSSSSVEELETMRNSAKASESVREIFGPLTDEEVRGQIAELVAKSDVLTSTLREGGASDAVVKAVITRLDHMVTWAREKEKPTISKSEWDEDPVDPNMPSKVTEAYFSGWDSFELQGNSGLKDSLKKGILNMEKKRALGYKNAAAEMGMSVGAYKAKLQDLTKRFIDATFPGIVVHSAGTHEAFSKVFSEEGRFKGLFETGDGCGCTRKESRSTYEHRVFGIVDDVRANAHLRPIYGVSANNERGYYGGDEYRSASGYGDVFVEIKRDKALHAATITTGDSLNSDDRYFPVPFGKPHFTMFRGLDDPDECKSVIQGIEDYIGGDKKKLPCQGSYLEMQYHNQLLQSDVEKIHCLLGKGKETDKSITRVMQTLIDLAGKGGLAHKVDLYVSSR